MSLVKSRKLRRSGLLLIAGVTLLLIPGTALGIHVYSDVSDSNTHRAGIEYAAQTGVSQGCAAGRFCPRDFVTRAQMATFLYRSSGNDPGTPPSVNADKLDGIDGSQVVWLTSARLSVCEPGDFPVLTTERNWICGFIIAEDVIAGAGLTRVGNVVSVDFAGAGGEFGSSDQVARGDHHHDTAYLGIGAQAADSDLLDGLDSTAFAATGHVHPGAGDADTLDGFDSVDFAFTAHDHDAAYLGVGTQTPTGNFQVSNGSPNNALTLACPAGTTVISGGFEKPGDSDGAVVDITANHPSGNGWRVAAVHLDGGNHTVTVHAVCAPST